MTYGVPRTLGRNALVTICAFLVGYGVLTVAIFAEMNFSEFGEARPTESSPPSTVDESEAVFDSMEASFNRFRFVYHPLALVLPALIIARFSKGWEWSWLFTALGCSFSLLAVVFSFGNLGRGQIFGLLIYILVAASVTLVVYFRERNEDASPSFKFAVRQNSL